MKIEDINPFVRFARKNECKFTNNSYMAPDHRIFYCHSGFARIQMKDNVYELKPDSVIYWRAGMKYRVFDTEGSNISGCNFDFTHENEYFSRPIAPSLISEAIPSVFERPVFEETDIFTDCFMIHNARILSDKFAEIADEFEKQKMCYQYRCSAILKDILILCIRLSGITKPKRSSKNMDELLRYLKKNYKRNLSNSDLASHLGYHPNYLNNLVVRHTGVSLHQYILKYKINIAMDLLQSTDMSVGEVASEVGFSDMKHFSKVFKNMIGIPPSYYRHKL